MSAGNGLLKDLNKLKVAELKEELDNRGLPIDGLKKDVSIPSLALLCILQSRYRSDCSLPMFGAGYMNKSRC